MIGKYLVVYQSANGCGNIDATFPEYPIPIEHIREMEEQIAKTTGDNVVVINLIKIADK